MSFLSKPKAPAPMNVGAVTAASNEQNSANAAQQAAYNRPNQQNQYGSTLSYQQTGTDARGNPIFSQTQNLGEQGTQFAGGFAGLGQQYIQGASDFQANRPDLSGGAALTKAEDYTTANINRQYGIQRDQLDNKLKNQGLQPGTEAYDNAMRNLDNSFGDQKNTMIANTQNQFFNQGLANRNQQASEFNLLQPAAGYAGNTITGPFANVPGINVANTDVAGLYRQNQQDQNNLYNEQMKSYNGMLGGLASIGGTAAEAAAPYLLPMMLSDARAKRDIERVGHLDSGLPIYSYRYVGDNKKQIGVMAQEAEQVAPEAVAEIGGLKHVDYGKLVDALNNGS